ncbi:hypothetical protein IFT68_00745 [Oxalobacteraceae sp. CFBP 13730]|nr:hypothetical protein [Oxalobacteraceae sp. CFBP 13730]
MEVMEIERQLEVMRGAATPGPGSSQDDLASAAEYRVMIDALESMLTEVNLANPSIDALLSLDRDMQSAYQALVTRTATQIRSRSIGGSSGEARKLADAQALIKILSAKVVEAVQRRIAEVQVPAPEAAPTPVEVDTTAQPDEDTPMTTPTRDEIDLKIENMQLRMDGRLSSIEGKMDALAAQVGGSERAMALLAERAVAAAESAGNLKQTLWITSITTILSVLGIALAAYFGTQASNIGIVGSTISAFEAGRAASAATPPITPAPATPAK